MNTADKPLNLRTLEIFSTVVDTGGMTLAAAKLGLTQSAVSQAIRALEETLQVTLFDRSVRPPALTFIGQVVAKHASDVSQRVRTLEQAIRFSDNSPVPVLRVGMVDSFARAIGPGLLRRLNHVADQWVIMSGASETRFEAVLSRRLDMVITTVDEVTPPELFDIEIFGEPCFIVAPKDYTGGRSIKALSENLNFIRSGHNMHITPQIEQYLNGQGVVPRKTYEFNSMEAAISMVEEGLGWTIVFPLGVLKSVINNPNRGTMPIALPGPPLIRRTRLVGHSANGIAIGKKVAETSRIILQEKLVPSLKGPFEWLAADVTLT